LKLKAESTILRGWLNENVLLRSVATDFIH